MSGWDAATDLVAQSAERRAQSAEHLDHHAIYREPVTHNALVSVLAHNIASDIAFVNRRIYDFPLENL